MIEGPNHEKLELYFSCRKLVNMDTFSKTDAFVVLYKLERDNWYSRITEGAIGQDRNHLGQSQP